MRFFYKQPGMIQHQPNKRTTREYGQVKSIRLCKSGIDKRDGYQRQNQPNVGNTVNMLADFL